MTWLSAIGLFLKCIDAVLQYTRDKQLVDGAVAERVAANLQGALNEIQTAQKIRDAVRAAAVADPASVRAPDANSRD